MPFEWRRQDTVSGPANQQLENKYLGLSLHDPKGKYAGMTGLEELPHICTMVILPRESCEEHTQKDFRYPQDWDTKWWRRPKIFDLATDNLSSYTIYETIAHYKLIDPNWTFESIFDKWSRIGQLTDIAQLSPQDKIDLCEQELQFSAMIFGREEAKQHGRSEPDRQFLRGHLENCRELYSYMLVEYKKMGESSARVETNDITDFWQYLGKSSPNTAFEVMNAFRLDLGRFTFWKQVIARSIAPSDVALKINNGFSRLTQIGKSCQNDRVSFGCRSTSVAPRRYRSPDPTILRHWTYRAKLIRCLSQFTSRNRPLH